jgi:hypothetical protein
VKRKMKVEGKVKRKVRRKVKRKVKRNLYVRNIYTCEPDISSRRSISALPFALPLLLPLLLELLLEPTAPPATDLPKKSKILRPVRFLRTGEATTRGLSSEGMDSMVRGTCCDSASCVFLRCVCGCVWRCRWGEG